MSRFSYTLTRNPNPDRSPEVMSLDELRHHMKRIWAEPMYGLTLLHGAKGAFIARCGYDNETSFRSLFLAPYDNEYLSADKQRSVSRAVREALTGRLKFAKDKDGRVVCYISNRGPVRTLPPIKREIRWQLDGAKVRRVPSA